MNGSMEVDDPQPHRSVAFNQIARSNSGSFYPLEYERAVPGSKYRLKPSPPQTLYSEPAQNVKGQLWSNSQDRRTAKQESDFEGGPRAHLIDDPMFFQSLNNRALNVGIQAEVESLQRSGYSWRYIAEVFFSRLGSLTGLGTKQDMKDYQVLYFKLLSLIPSGLLEDPTGEMKSKLIYAIDILGGKDKVGKARRKTRGRKKLRKTIRKK